VGNQELPLPQVRFEILVREVGTQQAIAVALSQRLSGGRCAGLEAWCVGRCNHRSGAVSGLKLERGWSVESACGRPGADVRRG
jgi:hypothetical protein